MRLHARLLAIAPFVVRLFEATCESHFVLIRVCQKCVSTNQLLLKTIIAIA
jgi:hypothetical protein